MREWGLHCRRLLASSAALLLSACATVPAALDSPLLAPPTNRQCQMADGDRQWLSQALANWNFVRSNFLRVDEQPLPLIVTYDARCSYTLVSPSSAQPRWTVAEHGGEIALPNHSRIPPAPNAFNAATSEAVNFVVMSLPSIWRPVAPPSEIPLDWFLEAVLLHELTHAYQSVATPSVSFAALVSPDASISDDTVQQAFERNADYVRDYESERHLLFRAASAESDEAARALACQALAKLRERRHRYLASPSGRLRLIDEISLTTEGLGQWVGYAWLTRGRGLAPALVLSKLRSPFWSQDEGLAIFLTVDRLVPGWQHLAFAAPPATAEVLLAQACGGGTTRRYREGPER